MDEETGVFSTNNTVTPQTVPEITPWEFARALELGERMQIVDVRASKKIPLPAAGLIPDEWTRRIEGSELLRLSDLKGTGIDCATPVVVICGHGNDSKAVAVHLHGLGAKARSLTGGMAAWMGLCVPRILNAPRALDRLVQFDRVGKESLSYVLISSGEAMIIDPPRDSSAHLRCIEDAGATLVSVADTHAHADYISGAHQLAGERGIPYYLHPEDGVYPYDGRPGRLAFHALSEAMPIRLGRCTLEVMHTPGHSPGSVTFVIDADAAFTGDFLFISSVGRPDLAEQTEAWSALLWKSIQRVRSTWTSDLMIYPAHYAPRTSRMSGGAIGAPFGRLLRENPSLGIREESAFLKWIRGKETTVPAAYRRIKGINLRLLRVDEREADTLENGRNECAAGGVSGGSPDETHGIQ